MRLKLTIPVEDSVGWDELQRGVERESVLVVGRLVGRESHLHNERCTKQDRKSARLVLGSDASPFSLPPQLEQKHVFRKTHPKPTPNHPILPPTTRINILHLRHRNLINLSRRRVGESVQIPRVSQQRRRVALVDQPCWWRVG